MSTTLVILAPELAAHARRIAAACGCDVVPRRAPNPTLVAHGLVAAARWHITTKPGPKQPRRAVADLYVGSKAEAVRVARALSTVLGGRALNLLNNKGLPKGHHPTTTVRRAVRKHPASRMAPSRGDTNRRVAELLAAARTAFERGDKTQAQRLYDRAWEIGVGPHVRANPRGRSKGAQRRRKLRRRTAGASRRIRRARGMGQTFKADMLAARSEGRARGAARVLSSIARRSPNPKRLPGPGSTKYDSSGARHQGLNTREQALHAERGLRTLGLKTAGVERRGKRWHVIITNPSRSKTARAKRTRLLAGTSRKVSRAFAAGQFTKGSYYSRRSAYRRGRSSARGGSVPAWENPSGRPVPPHSLDKAIVWLRAGGRLVVRTYTRITIMDAKTLARFEKAGSWLLKEDGDGYRMKSGRSSVYLLPGQLEYVIEDNPKRRLRPNPRGRNPVTRKIAGPFPAIVRRAIVETVVDIGQFNRDAKGRAEKRDLERYVRAGYLEKAKGGPFPIRKTVYAVPGYPFEAERQREIDAMMRLPNGPRRNPRGPIQTWTTTAMLAEIARLQTIQKRNPPTSAAWRAASRSLAPLFREMARREPHQPSRNPKAALSRPQVPGRAKRYTKGRAASRRRNPGDYVPVAEAAKQMRVALKRHFPTVKFSVRSRSYAGGASIDVSYTNGPRSADVDKIAQRFAGADFDGMTDLKSSRDSLLVGDDGTMRSVRYGSDFVFVRRTVSPTLQAAVIAELGARWMPAQWAKMPSYDKENMAWRGVSAIAIPDGEPEAVTAKRAADAYFAGEGRTTNPKSGRLTRKQIRRIPRGSARLARAQYRRKARSHATGVRRRTTNPTPAVARAAAVVRKFQDRGPIPVRTKRMKAPAPLKGAAAELGKLVGVVYRSDKFDGKTRDYEHDFSTPLPSLVTGPEGRGLHVVGGRYKITPDGIVN